MLARKPAITGASRKPNNTNVDVGNEFTFYWAGIPSTCSNASS
jgi:hypothetical protein